MIIDKKKLEFAMARSCMTTTDVVRQGVSRGTFNTAIRRSKNVNPATVGKIAKALGVDVTEIIED